MKLRPLLPVLSPAILFCAALAAEAAETIPPSALALADAMLVVETTRLTMEARTQADIAKGTKSQKELDCWKVTDFTPVRSVFAEAFAGVMTTAEMDEATAFLVTPLGKKFVQYMNAEAMKARGWSSPAVASLTDEEAEVAVEFVSKGAGSKLYSESLQTAALQKQLLDSLLPMFKKCMEPKSAARHFSDLQTSMTPEERARAAASAADTARTSQSAAVKLVRAMREDEYLLTVLRQRMNTNSRALDKAQRECVESFKPTDISGAMAVSVQEQLSAAEVKDAIAFYESDTGRKYTEIAFMNIERPVEVEDFFKLMTVEQAQSLRKFFVLSASRKLMLDKVLQQPSSMNRVGLRLRELTEACLRERGANR
jgi:hypothetical protein